MAGVNKVILIGNLGTAPEVRTLESGAKVANFNIATNEVYKDKNGEKQERTEWHRIVLWRGLAEIAEKYLKKGDRVFLEGRLRTRQWQDKDGNNRYTTEILGDNMLMLGGKGSDNQQGPPPPSNENISESDSQVQEADDDLPF